VYTERKKKFTNNPPVDMVTKTKNANKRTYVVVSFIINVLYLLHVSSAL
jgi:hypothetical protein